MLAGWKRSSVGCWVTLPPVGEGVFEMREFFGPGWRMYYVQQGEVLIVMLGGAIVECPVDAAFEIWRIEDAEEAADALRRL